MSLIEFKLRLKSKKDEIHARKIYVIQRRMLKSKERRILKSLPRRLTNLRFTSLRFTSLRFTSSFHITLFFRKRCKGDKVYNYFSKVDKRH